MSAVFWTRIAELEAKNKRQDDELVEHELKLERLKMAIEDIVAELQRRKGGRPKAEAA